MPFDDAPGAHQLICDKHQGGAGLSRVDALPQFGTPGPARDITRLYRSQRHRSDCGAGRWRRDGDRAAFLFGARKRNDVDGKSPLPRDRSSCHKISGVWVCLYHSIRQMWRTSRVLFSCSFFFPSVESRQLQEKRLLISRVAKSSTFKFRPIAHTNGLLSR